MDRDIIKKQNRPPAGVQVRLAALQPDRYLLRALGRVYEFREQGDKALCLTITIGRLVVQVLSGPCADTKALRTTGRLGTDVTRIFPPQAETVPWPPPKPLDDASLLTLVSTSAWGGSPSENDDAADCSSS